jgi:long-chain acyl-CoA synthetase
LIEKRWYKSYDPGVPHTINPDQYNSIIEMVDEAFVKFSNSPCFTNFGETLTFKRIHDLSVAYAGFLQTECHLVKGDCVAIMMPNVLQYPVAIYGGLRAGCVIVNISPLASPEEVHETLKITEAKCILVLENLAHVVEKAIPNTSVQSVIVTEIGDLFRFPKNKMFNFIIKHIKKMVPQWNIPQHHCFTKAVKSNYQTVFKKVDLKGQDLAYLQFTEGRSIGKPKYAMLMHRNFVANALQCSMWGDSFFASKFKGNAITAMPLFKLVTFTTNCLTLMRLGVENRIITNPRDIASVIQEMRRRKFNMFSGIRTFFQALLKNEKFYKIDFTGLKFTNVAGMFTPKILADRWEAATGVILTQGYFTVEAAPMITTVPMSSKVYTGYVGLPLPSTEAKICDETGKELPIGEKGEIWIRGPQVMKGYWKDPDLTKKVLTEDGWFKTGDIGTMNETGFLRLVDRIEDLIPTKNAIVYPSEVEAVITDIPGVEDAVVIKGTTETGEVYIIAYIVRSSDVLTQEEILSHCHRHLDFYQIPQVIEFRTSLPRTPSTLISRRQLRKEADTLIVNFIK